MTYETYIFCLLYHFNPNYAPEYVWAKMGRSQRAFYSSAV